MSVLFLILVQLLVQRFAYPESEMIQYVPFERVTVPTKISIVG